MKTISHISLLLLITLLPSTVDAQSRRIDMSFSGQLFSAVEELKEKMKADTEIEGRKLRLGKFSGPNLPDSNFDLEFERTFKTQMKAFLAEESPLVVNGEYKFLPGELPENKDLGVIQFVITIEFKFRKLQTVTREINRSADIVRIAGATIALPDTPDVEVRNKAAAGALIDPQFGVRDKHFVTVKGSAEHAVAVYKRVGGQGKAVPLTPRNLNGFAFVELDVTDTFAIVLANHDQRCDASADVSIDGLDVANTFSIDDVEYHGFMVPRSNGRKPGEHAIAGWLKTTKTRKENVFEFVVNTLGNGAATEMRSRHNQGIVHVDFYEAVPSGEVLPSRKFGEVGKGRPLDVAYTVQQMTRRDSPIASISIRYRNPERQ
ncbi:MAG: hypothetical protein ACI9HK_001924 [Pirellulaceae bacterium]|jgi:hypothetical protein